MKSSDAHEKSSSAWQTLVCCYSVAHRLIYIKSNLMIQLGTRIKRYKGCVVRCVCVCVVRASGATLRSIVCSLSTVLTLLHFRSCNSEPWEKCVVFTGNKRVSHDRVVKRAVWKIFLLSYSLMWSHTPRTCQCLNVFHILSFVIQLSCVFFGKL